MPVNRTSYRSALSPGLLILDQSINNNFQKNQKLKFHFFCPSFFSSQVFSVLCLTTSLTWMEMDQVRFLRWHHLHWIFWENDIVNCIMFQQTALPGHVSLFSYICIYIYTHVCGCVSVCVSVCMRVCVCCAHCIQNPLLFLQNLHRPYSTCHFWSRLGNLLHIPCCLATVENMEACVLLTRMRPCAFWLTRPTEHT